MGFMHHGAAVINHPKGIKSALILAVQMNDDIKEYK